MTTASPVAFGRSAISVSIPSGASYHDELGFNFRLTNLQAAVGVGQIERVDETVARKREVAAPYTERLRDLDGLQLPVQEPWARNVYWMYGVVVDEATGLDAATLFGPPKSKGVETRPFFLGMHEQPVFRRMGLFDGESYPVAERLARQALYLPSGTAITDAQVDAVCDEVARAPSS